MDLKMFIMRVLGDHLKNNLNKYKFKKKNFNFFDSASYRNKIINL